MGTRHALGAGLAAGAALLVAGVASAGLVGLHGSTAAGDATVTATPTLAPATADATATSTTPPARGPVDVLAEAHLVPSRLQVRAVRSAALLLVVDDGSGPTFLALDAADGAWVRLDLPEEPIPPTARLSPDGTRLLLADAERVGPSRIEILELATGEIRELRAPLSSGDLGVCAVSDVAWAPSGARIGVVTGCLDRTGPEPIPGSGTWVHEVDLATGVARVVEHMADVSPAETRLSYSLDGSFLAYGVVLRSGDDGAEPAPDVRVVALDGSDGREAIGLRPVDADPWLDGVRLVARGEETEGAVPYLRVDARTATTTPLGVPGAREVRGVVAGRAVVGATPEGPCPVTLCTADPTTGAVRPWLSLPDDVRVVTLRTARSLVAL